MTRPLVVRFGALGDMVLMTVAIRSLSLRFGSAVDVLAAGEWTQPLLAGQPGVGEIFVLRSRKLAYWLSPAQRSLVRELRQRGPGPTWLFDSRNDKTLWLMRRAGWDSGWLAQLDRLPDIAGEHFCDRWRRFAQLDPPARGGEQHAVEASPAFPQLFVSAESQAELAEWLRPRGLEARPLILLQVGNKRTMRRGGRQRASNTKYWPERHWATVLCSLRALHPEHALLLLGVPAEAALNDEILALAQVPDAYNLAPEMTVSRLMALADRAAGMISVDTGPAHVAAALGCPVLTLFDSAVKFSMYAPRGPGAAERCTVVSSDSGPSLRGVAPDEVLTAWRAMTLRTHVQAEPSSASRPAQLLTRMTS